jgi:hypothetical protein
VGLLTVKDTGSLWPKLNDFAAAPEHASALEEAGFVIMPLETVHMYQATPLNTVTFASTGLGGVHFGFLATSDQALDASPVVMTAPLAAEPNLVVGETLHEFLCLGFRQGWSFLDQFVHDPAWARSWYRSGAPAAYPALAELARLLGLEPWPDVPSRLAKLNRLYRRQLVVRPNEPPEE